MSEETRLPTLEDFLEACGTQEVVVVVRDRGVKMDDWHGSWKTQGTASRVLTFLRNSRMINGAAILGRAPAMSVAPALVPSASGTAEWKTIHLSVKL